MNYLEETIEAYECNRPPFSMSATARDLVAELESHVESEIEKSTYEIIEFLEQQLFPTNGAPHILISEAKAIEICDRVESILS